MHVNVVVMSSRLYGSDSNALQKVLFSVLRCGKQRTQRSWIKSRRLVCKPKWKNTSKIKFRAFQVCYGNKSCIYWIENTKQMNKLFSMRISVKMEFTGVSKAEFFFSLQCNMILQKTFQIKKHSMLKRVVLTDIFVENVVHLIFEDCLKNRKFKRRAFI